MHDELPPNMGAYHTRTKHAPNRYALGPAFLDWDSQPNPFRSFEGARRVPLPLGLDTPTPPFDALNRQPPLPVNAQSLGLFLELALGLSAWKEMEQTRWALRNNPSSGNLHPTEGWVVLPALDSIGPAALYHYAPYHHALEERCVFERAPALPPGGFLLALSSVTWREAWKYGERSFRYCQHDVGHALAAISYAAACVGWTVRVLPTPSDAQVASLLGLDRADSQHRYENEHPDLVAVVTPAELADFALPVPPGHFALDVPPGDFTLDVPPGRWFGHANAVSDDHERWPAVEAALRLSAKPVAPAPIRQTPPRQTQNAPDLAVSAAPAAQIIRARRSAQRMDGRTAITRDGFFRMLARCLPDSSHVPFSAFPWPPRLHLFLFVHRVEGVEPGLYALIRDPDALDRLKAACSPCFAWAPLAQCPLPLYHLHSEDLRRTASGLSCLQAIAGHSAFSLGMVADFARTLDEDGEWSYRRLFWEAGMIGQVLYLEATAAGVSGTGIGCFFDDSVHEFLGLDGAAMAWQSLYHFTVGGAMEDQRLATLPAYAHLETA